MKGVLSMEKMTNAKALNYVLTTYEDIPSDVRERLTAMHTSLLSKSTNRKPTATQVENEQYKVEILGQLSAIGMTVTEIQHSSETLSELSNQRVSALLKQLVTEGKVVKSIDKKKSYFSLA